MSKVHGLDELIRDLKRLPKEAETGAIQITETYGRLTEFQAVEKVAVDHGKLRQSGFYESTNRGFGAKITFSVPYAPFVEFGTGGLVSIPEGWEELAGQFKGAGKREVNLPARPFLIPTFLINGDLYYKALDAMLARLVQ
ncbi:hypothetical protein GO755_30470 [Spirosoma sp. HMF4905]|uniref:HK97 gp10 family phage protein n=1 Tax=Spirosoma arboris TaxID=2682092 RepID=A0A7K1SLE5_9BACT|nr:HK97 gp10 family phage protein [Spirosoma arboris]MVM34396.1 hypothetical protein [Spirosoma arboris]